ncbi:ZIP zinc transporter-domain-containing protein [Lineolata rhizophorae]|uniref:ZIP zinc transporter-domain-containing protein n=1 Tax=Lineolata rhizophorae TaxID=578093 RepID=A0A6A6NX36_9PEZI|nr:ZIP zinc transporter-domain-containing protein [Lineolata rhizophorae]
MTLDNDTRGWIMTALSGVACVLGSSIICVDLLIRLIPGKKNFKIQDSNPFLSSSLSLSFGVMLFSSLYSMLPSAKSSLQKGGHSPKAAAWILIACFIGGVIGIQVVSRILHRYMPSHVVDCDHTHEAEIDAKEQGTHGHHDHHEDHDHNHDGHEYHSSHHHHAVIGAPSRKTQSAPHPSHPSHSAPHAQTFGDYGSRDATARSSIVTTESDSAMPNLSRRPSLVSKVSNIVTGAPEFCGKHGQCYGYSDLCGHDCYKIVQARGGIKAPAALHENPQLKRGRSIQSLTPLENVDEEMPLLDGALSPTSGEPVANGSVKRGSSVASQTSIASKCPGLGHEHEHEHEHEQGHHHDHIPGSSHHHHVPANAFLSIGLQTSIAIALHKLPEGFITYATNHANPRLGFAVFLALFIHNITEGFAMALPLYLALGSRLKAMLVAAILGGVSQPAGAGVAAVWFRVARMRGGGAEAEPSEAVYGGMFAVTAGIMASVALQLFSESLDLTHNRNLCMVFAFVGMGVLGVSSALTS